MADAAVISGSLVDAKNVNTHKVMRLIIDVPAENALKVIAAFGWPTMVNPVSVAVARLDERKVMSSDRGLPIQESTPDTPPRLESNASAGADNPGYCVAVAMGGPRCVGRCEVPKDCGATPLPADKPKKSPAQIAGYLCTTMAFYRFLKEKFQDQLDLCDAPTYREAAAQCVRIICNVDSRADIAPDNTEWLSLMLAYKLWQNHPELEDA